MANTNSTRRKVTVTGYDVLATAVCDYGRVIVLGNNSNWLGICEQDDANGDLSETVTVVQEFSYGREPFVSTFRQALAAMTELALRNLSFEDGSDYDDNLTDDQVGCGFRG